MGMSEHKKIHLSCNNRLTSTSYWETALMRLLSVSFTMIYLLCTVSSFAQNKVSGIVTDSTTLQPLAFVNLIANGNQRVGTFTDIDGRFSIKHSEPIRSLQFSYVGYKPLQIDITKDLALDQLQISLTKNAVALEEVTILPGINPAHRIIKNAVKKRSENNPENLDAFQYQSYNKMIYTSSNVERIKARIRKEYDEDDEKEVAKRDSTLKKVSNFFDQQHIFLTESVSERKFKRPFNDKEVILSTRVSGLENPSFASLATDIQPFSFYRTYIALLTKEFLNPISPGSTNKYLFIIEDTLYDAADSIFIISYRPRKGAQFEALKGVLSISSNNWALQNVIAEPAFPGKLNNLRIQQKYNRPDGKHWFPEQLNFDLDFKQQGLVFVGRSYLTKVNINPEFSRTDFDHLLLEVDEDAANRSPEFWEENRVDTLTKRDQKTYQVVDSIGKEVKLDRIMEIATAAASDRFNIGPIALIPSHIYRYNDYEGHRLGIGAVTSENLSKTFAVGGYAAYGFRDQGVKYGGHFELTINDKRDVRFKLNYQNDVQEPGSTSYLDGRYLNSTENLRNLLVKQMNEVEGYSASFTFRTARFALVELLAEQHETRMTGDYQYAAPAGDLDILTNRFDITRLGARLRFAYKERLTQSFGKTVSLGTRFPIFWATAYRAFDDLGNGQFAYDKLDARMFYEFRLRNIGKIRLNAEAGAVIGDAPYTELNFGRGSYRSGLQLVVDNSFQTMRINEFLADRYVKIFYTHHLGYLRFGDNDKVKPGVILSHNSLFGSLEQPDRHRGIDFETAQHGFHEAGLILENLFRIKYVDIAYLGLGAGAFYRYGPYHLESTADNIALKVDVTLEF